MRTLPTLVLLSIPTAIFIATAYIAGSAFSMRASGVVAWPLSVVFAAGFTLIVCHLLVTSFVTVFGLITILLVPAVKEDIADVKRFTRRKRLEGAAESDKGHLSEVDDKTGRLSDLEKDLARFVTFTEPKS